MPLQPADYKRAIGFDPERCRAVEPDRALIEFINLQLAAMGQPIYGKAEDYPMLRMGQSLMAHYQAKDRLREELRPPVDLRIQSFLNDYLHEVRGYDVLRLPGAALNLDHHGIARMLSVPPDRDEFQSEIVDSYRVRQGVLHNPKSDRRTTKGVFHVCEGGLPIPADKKAVPKHVFFQLLKAALNPPQSHLLLPFTASQEQKAYAWVSLLLRPVVCPDVPGYTPEKSMEVRFYAPGTLVSNLDFVESIFGNAGDPYLRENDAGLDIEHWSGHTGCVILAPHILGLKKKDLGLPHISEANERQRRDGMCWEKDDEFYNDGGAFKITARDERGVIVTLISDNYFGYCKKEVKTQISYASNLLGLCEEEHSGGALSFASYDCGEEFSPAEFVAEEGHSFEEVKRLLGDSIEVKAEGYAVDRRFTDIVYVPEGARFSLTEQKVTWPAGGNGAGGQLKLLSGKTYITPVGYKVELMKPAAGRRWRLVGTVPEATYCHKPCTVSGGGKSEIAKSISDAVIHAPLFVEDLQKDLARAAEIISRDYSNRFRDPARNGHDHRGLLSPERSLGSVVKLLTPSESYNDEHNQFLAAMPRQIKDLVLLVKRFWKAHWGENWRERFSVDIIDGVSGHELKYRDEKVYTGYLRVGYDSGGHWRVFGLRKDFSPSAKVQMEDDITASVVVPAKAVSGLGAGVRFPSVKITRNCEYRLFQRPDDAIIPGYDHKAEYDLAQPGSFLSNWQPLDRREARAIVEDAVRFDRFTSPMRSLLAEFDAQRDKPPHFVVCSANPRLVDGKPTKNPRYLQTRIGLEDPRSEYIAEVGERLRRKLPVADSVPFPVDVVVPGRRNNPPEPGVRSLAVYNPIHYMPLPEAFIEFISSMTGKSPSTTGAGSEGALTKAPFNALLPITDLNAAFVSFAVSGYQPFVTAAGYVGPKFRVDHDISLLIPEIWCRMHGEERDPLWLIGEGLLEAVPDLEHEGRRVPSSILGYRITGEFVNRFLGRIFSNPDILFTEEMLRPELQDLAVFAEGIDNIVTTHRWVAQNYFADGSIDLACPPLRALLHIMAEGHYQGRDLKDAELRSWFERDRIMESEWYHNRLHYQQRSDIIRIQRMLDYVENADYEFEGLARKKERARQELARVSAPAYLAELVGTIGRDPIGIDSREAAAQSGDRAPVGAH